MSGLTRKSAFVRLLWLIFLAICVTVASVILSSTEVTKRMELVTFDWRFQAKQIIGRTLQPSEEIVIVAIDEKSAESLNPKVPTPRDYLSEIISFLSDAGAKLIVLDVLLDNPVSPIGDAKLSDAIKKAGNVILPCELSGEDPYILKPLLKDYAQNALAIGFANVYPDADNYVRRMPVVCENVTYADTGTIFSLPITIYTKYLEIEAKKKINMSDTVMGIPTYGSGYFFINYAGERDTFNSYPSFLFFLEAKPLDIIFKDKIVLIGATHKDIRDSYLLTPFYKTLRSPIPGYMPGVEIIANALNTLINRSFIHKITSSVVNIITFALIISVLIILFRIHPLKGAVIVFCGIIAWWVFSFVIFSFGNYTISVIQPTIGYTVAYVCSILRSFSREVRRSQSLRNMFEKYVSPEVIQEIIRQAEDIATVERRKVTILFSDLKDSVSWAEALKSEPEQLVKELNEYFTGMVDVIFEYGGTLLRFTGDGLFAVYGAPLERSNPALDAVLTGIEMQRRLSKLNEQRKAVGKRILLMRIGINTGEVVMGDVGSERRREYGAMGDAVNVAQRTEGQCEPGYVAITEATYLEVKEHIVVESMGMQNLKGKNESVMLYRVLSSKNIGSAES